MELDPITDLNQDWRSFFGKEKRLRSAANQVPTAGCFTGIDACLRAANSHATYRHARPWSCFPRCVQFCGETAQVWKTRSESDSADAVGGPAVQTHDLLARKSSVRGDGLQIRSHLASVTNGDFDERSLFAPDATTLANPPRDPFANALRCGLILLRETNAHRIV